MCSEGSTFRYNIDKLAVVNGSIRGWGWVQDTKDISSVLLILKNDKKETELLTNLTYTRVDVEKKYGKKKAAGFWFFKPLSSVPDRVLMRIIYKDGTSRQVDITSFMDSSRPIPPPMLSSCDLKKALMYLRQGRFGLLMKGAVKRLFTLTTRLRLAIRKHLTPPKMFRITASDLIIDHDLGGGANLYTEKLLGKLKEDGKSVAVLRYNFLNAIYSLKIFSPEKTISLELQRIDTFFFNYFENLSTVILNNIFSFEEPLLVLKMLEDIKLKSKHRCRIVFILHDYFCICPSYALLDSRGNYCGLPDSFEICEACLSSHNGNVAKFFPNGFPSIKEWRTAWERFFSVVDEIVCFSNRSVEILLKVYPSVSDKVVRHTHKIQAFSKKPRISFEKGIHIGIVGHISEEKGAKLVYDLALLISEKKLPVKLTVLGTIEAKYFHPTIRITGAYRREALPRLIEKTGANIFFIPSVCPETYNLVADELMALDLPLAVLSVNAAAERVKRYHKGLIIEETRVEDILMQLLKFFEFFSDKTRENK